MGTEFHWIIIIFYFKCSIYHHPMSCPPDILFISIPTLYYCRGYQTIYVHGSSNFMILYYFPYDFLVNFFLNISTFYLSCTPLLSLSWMLLSFHSLLFLWLCSSIDFHWCCFCFLLEKYSFPALCSQHFNFFPWISILLFVNIVATQNQHFFNLLILFSSQLHPSLF